MIPITPKVKKILKVFISIFLVAVSALAGTVSVFAEDTTVAPAATPDYSGAYAVGFPNSLAGAASTGGFQWGGAYTSAADATNFCTRRYGFDSTTGVYTCSFLGNATGKSVYLAFKGVDVVSYSSNRDYVTITPVTGTPSLTSPVVVWYDPPGFPTHAVDSLPSDCVWYRIDCTYTNGSQYEANLTFTLEIPQPAQQEEVLDAAKLFFTTGLTFGSAIITFILTYNICLIALALYVGIALFMLLRRLIKGV